MGKVTSPVDFVPYLESLQKFHEFLTNFKRDMNNPSQTG